MVPGSRLSKSAIRRPPHSRYDVCVGERVIAVERLRLLSTREEVGDTIGEILKIAQGSAGLHHREKIDQTAPVVGPWPILHGLSIRVRFQVGIQRKLGAKFR